ncbi:MAG: amino acid/amide transporter rane protein 1, family [Frankiales bacterium]|nr:amino acid/amide transporter rane protein 1, family [Frankiales bacterium]
MSAEVLALDVVAPAVSGFIQGSVYGLLGLGLVLLYKSNRIFNFAQAEFGGVAAFVWIFFDTGRGVLPNLPTPVAVLLGILAAVLVALLTERLVVRPLFNAPKITVVVATAGVLLLLIAVEGFLYGGEAGSFPAIFSGDAVNSGAIRVTNQGVAIVVVLAVLSILAALFFSRSPFGTAILAVSQEATAARLVGISVERISALTWGIAGFLAGVAGILLAGTIGLAAPGSLTGLALVPAFTAAVFGGVTSLPGALVGGIVIGIIESEAQALIPKENLPGAGKVALFVALLLVLLVRPAGLLGKET